REKAAIFIGSRPFHRQQYRTAPFAADPDPLDQADDHQEEGPPDADRFVGRHETDGCSGNTGHQQGSYQGRLASDAVAPMAEYRRSDRPTEKSDEKDREGLQNADDRIRLRKKELAEDQPCDLPVKQKVIPFNRSPDRAGDQRTAQLPAML